jgi:multiple sugar transport system permease protein
VRSRLLLYALVALVSLWLVGPFAWLFVTSISYQKHLLARPLSFVPPEVTLDNYRMIMGLVRFHAEGQAAPSRSCCAGTSSWWRRS